MSFIRLFIEFMYCLCIIEVQFEILARQARLSRLVILGLGGRSSRRATVTHGVLSGIGTDRPARSGRATDD